MAAFDPMGASKLQVLLMTVAVAMFFLSGEVEANSYNLRPNYYSGKCGKYDVESIIYNEIAKAFQQDNGVAPGLVRMAFHDCFVRVSVDSPSSCDFVQCL